MKKPGFCCGYGFLGFRPGVSAVKSIKLARSLFCGEIRYDFERNRSLIWGGFIIDQNMVISAFIAKNTIVTNLE